MHSFALDAWTAHRLGQVNRVLCRDDLVRYHTQALKELLSYCQTHSTFYRRKWAGIDVAAINGTTDLQRLPCTTADELRQYGREMLCVGQDAVARIVTLRSSGSTGVAKRLFFTDEDLERTRDFFHHGMLHILEPGRRAAIFLPGESPDSTGALLAEALGRMGSPCRIFGLVQDLTASAARLAQWQPQVLIGFPVQMLALARMARHLGCWPDSISALLLCSDYIPHSICTALRRQFGCTVFSHYGSVESGLGAAVDCPFHAGLHLRESDLLVEIVTESLQPQALGEWGEIVTTTLTRRGMPLVRYRSGDRGRLLPGNCSCGSVLARLDRVGGRMAGVLPLAAGGTLSLPELDESLFSLPAVLDFQAALYGSPCAKESLQVLISTVPGYGEKTAQQIGAMLKRMIQFHDIEIKVSYKSAAVLQQGKRQLIDYREIPPHESTDSTTLHNP